MGNCMIKTEEIEETHRGGQYELSPRMTELLETVKLQVFAPTHESRKYLNEPLHVIEIKPPQHSDPKYSQLWNQYNTPSTSPKTSPMIKYRNLRGKI